MDDDYESFGAGDEADYMTSDPYTNFDEDNEEAESNNQSSAVAAAAKATSTATSTTTSTGTSGLSNVLKPVVKNKGGRPRKDPNAPVVPTLTINIREFDINSIPPFAPSDKSGVKIVVIGKAGVGKSTVIKALLASKAHLAPVIQVFNGTEDNNGGYSSFCPSVFVYDKLDLNAMIAFKNRQTIAGHHIPENPWAIQVIDDCTDDPKQLRHPVVQAYYKNGRHWHMIHILSLQYGLDIMPNIRSNIDYTILMRESSKKNLKKLYENYCPDCVESFEDFCEIMKACTEDFGALVICNRTTSNKIEDCLFWYKADPKAISPTFKFGHQVMWEFNAERYDPDYQDSLIKP